MLVEMRPSWANLMPQFQGDLKFGPSLARYTWFKTGGPAEALFRPKNLADLALFLDKLPESVPVTVMGNASNILVRDGGIEGVVIRLGKGFSKIQIEGDALVAGAGAADLNVAKFARRHGISGMEFLAGVPGTIGGALAMNAGAYGKELKDICISADIVLRDGTVKRTNVDDFGFAYRNSQLNGAIVISARLKVIRGNPHEIGEHIKQIRATRENTQPTRTLTGGSTFKNLGDRKAWELIDAAGCRGLRCGGAVVSEKHCNFLINEGNASAADLEKLGECIRNRVKAHSGIVLEWEIERIGRAGENVPSEVMR